MCVDVCVDVYVDMCVDVCEKKERDGMMGLERERVGKSEMCE